MTLRSPDLYLGDEGRLTKSKSMILLRWQMPKELCLELIEIESLFTNIGSSNENNVNFQNCFLGTQQIYNCEFSINQSIFEIFLYDVNLHSYIFSTPSTSYILDENILHLGRIFHSEKKKMSHRINGRCCICIILCSTKNISFKKYRTWLQNFSHLALTCLDNSLDV